MGMTTDDIHAIVYRVRDELIKHQKHIPLFPGLKDAVSALAKSHPLLIATSNESSVVEKFLSLHDMNMFGEVLGSDSEPSKVKKLRSIKKGYPLDQCVYIGDTAGDIIEGRQAEVITVAVTWGWHDEQRLRKTNPDYVIITPDELKELDHMIQQSSSASRKIR
jgi:phosphoglycolate phosphatase